VRLVRTLVAAIYGITAVSSCEIERDLACRTQFRDSVASVSK
jgi:hypothetical protein